MPEAGADRTRAFSGTVEASTTVSLSFRIDGQLTSVNVNVGDFVEKGDVIAKVDTTDFELKVRESEASLAQARAEERNARANYDRVSDLYEEESVSLAELDEARAQAESSKAGVRSAEQSLALARQQLEYTTLYAPEAMAVTQVNAEANENVRAGDEIAVAVYGDRPQVKVAVPESLIEPIRKGDRVKVRFDAIADEAFEATITEVGIAATQGGTTFPVTVELENRDRRLRAGMAAKVDIRFFAQSSGRVVIPTFAVGEDQAGTYVYALDPGQDGTSTTRRMAVAVGELTSDGMEIVSGLSGGEIIATAGVPRIRDGMKVTVLRADR